MTAAADRVAEFLARRKRVTGLDQETLAGFDGLELLASDLRELLADSRAQHPTGTPTADHRITAEILAGDRPAPGADAGRPIGSSAASYTAQIAHALDAAYDAGYDAGMRDGQRSVEQGHRGAWSE